MYEVSGEIRLPKRCIREVATHKNTGHGRKNKEVRRYQFKHVQINLVIRATLAMQMDPEDERNR